MGPVSVVIPVRNDADGLPAAVASVLAQRDVEPAEIWLAVGPSEDGTEAVARDLAKRHPEVTVLENHPGGIADGLNLGLAAAGAEVLVRLDARCTLPEDFVRTALATMAETGAANVGAVQVPVGTTPMQRAIAAAMRHPLGSGGAAYRRGARKQQVETAFLGVFRCDALRSVGGWDVRFARNEDAELNLRLRAAGHEVWLDPALRVEYGPRQSLRTLARQFFDYGWWRRRTAARHGAVQLRQLAAPLLVAGSAVAVGLAIAVSPVFLVAPGGYLVVVLAGAATAEGVNTIAGRLRVAAALATMHAAWGAGFIASSVRGPWSIGPATES